MEKLLLVDGLNLLFQMFYGMPNKIYGQNGKCCHGVIGFIGGLLKSINFHKPDYLLVIFDGENNGNRKEINTLYKANRIDYSLVPEEDNPFVQYHDILKSLDYLSINYIETNGYEADDLIASYVKTYDNDINIIIQSSDSDFIQLLSNNTFLFKYRGKNSCLITPEEVLNKYGVMPDKMAELKAIVGDNADNLKGVYKVGIKTAGKLLNEFQNIDGIYQNIDLIKSIKIKQNLLEAKELVKQNYELICLRGNIDIPISLENLKSKKDYHTYKTISILRELEIL